MPTIGAFQIAYLHIYKKKMFNTEELALLLSKMQVPSSESRYIYIYKHSYRKKSLQRKLHKNALTLILYKLILNNLYL